MRPMVAQTGNDLPVSAFVGYEDGTFPAGTTAYEKRGVATVVPEWNPANCIQCNQCSLVCPHAAIRPCVMTDEEMKKAPESMKAIGVKMPKELAGMHFRMQVSAMDCTGCGNCADVCPAKEKALVMKPFESQTGTTPRSASPTRTTSSTRRPTSRTASSHSLCSSSAVPAPAAARPRTSSASPSSSASR